MRSTHPIRMLVKCAAALAFAALSALAHAGSLGVSPIRVHLAHDSPTTVLTLENGGATASVVQLQVMQWSAADGADHYEPTEDLVAMPPIVTIPPGGTQIVRLGLTREADPQRELAYRLYIEEVPPPPKPGFQGLQIALRIGVPIFVAPVAGAAPLLQWQVLRSSPAALTVSVTNAGNAHERLMKVSLRAPGDARVLATHQIVGDLLAGQSRQWSIPLAEDYPGARVRLSAETGRGATDVELDMGRR